MEQGCPFYSRERDGRAGCVGVSLVNLCPTVSQSFQMRSESWSWTGDMNCSSLFSAISIQWRMLPLCLAFHHLNSMEWHGTWWNMARWITQPWFTYFPTIFRHTYPGHEYHEAHHIKKLRLCLLVFSHPIKAGDLMSVGWPSDRVILSEQMS